MNKNIFPFALVACLLPLPGALAIPDLSDPFALGLEQTLTVSLPQSSPSRVHSFGRLPLSFVRNDGQADSATKFQVHGREYVLSLEETEAVMVLSGRGGEVQSLGRTASGFHLLRMKLAGVQTGAAITGENELPGKFNFFVGSDPALWRTNVPTFAKVRYHEIYSGIDLVFYGNEGQLEYDYIVKPGADPGQIAMAIEGADVVEVDARGDLRLEVAGHELFWRKPVLFQDVEGTRVPVAGAYVLLAGTDGMNTGAIRHVAFQIGPYNRAIALVIDPVLAYSTFLGGWYMDRPEDIAVDAAGCAYVIGGTRSSPTYGTPFPATPEAFRKTFYEAAAFVTKFNPAGDQLIYSTFLCGASTTQSSWATGIAIDGSGSAIVTGGTSARDFPRKNPLQSTYGGGDRDAFVTKLSPDGSALVFSSFLGGNRMESGSEGYPNTRVRLDGASNVYVAGTTESANFPTANPMQSAYGGNGDWFLTKLDASGTNLIYSTFLGGNTSESSLELAVDLTGHVYLTGKVYQGGEGYQRIVRLNPAGSEPDYSIILTNLWVEGIDVDRAGALYVAGWTSSETVPTTPTAFQRSLVGDDDGVVGKLNPAGSAWEYLTYLGGTLGDSVAAIAVDPNDNAFVAGITRSFDFPVRDAIQDSNHSGGEYGYTGFVSKLDSNGSVMIWSTYLGGGSGRDRPIALAMDFRGGVYVAGETSSWDFPVQNAFQSYPSTPGHLPYETFVTKLSEPRPPALQITRVGSVLSISWPVSAEGFTLESNASLGSAANWTAEPSVPSVVVDQNVLTIEIGEGSRFFRLRKQ